MILCGNAEDLSIRRASGERASPVGFQSREERDSRKGGSFSPRVDAFGFAVGSRSNENYNTKMDEDAYDVEVRNRNESTTDGKGRNLVASI